MDIQQKLLLQITINRVSKTVPTFLLSNSLKDVVGSYYAPISVVDRKYYRYDDYDYSITDVPLSETDMRQLTEAVELLKQMSSFKGFDDVEDVVNRLEDHVASMRFRVEPVILLEGNARYRRDPPDCRIASQIETMRSLGMDSWDGRRPADFPLRRGVPAETENN